MSNTFLQGGAKQFSGETNPLAPLVVAVLIIGNNFLFFMSCHCPPSTFFYPHCPTDLPASLNTIAKRLS